MKYIFIIAACFYVAVKFGMNSEALFDSVVNMIRQIDQVVDQSIASRGH